MKIAIQILLTPFLYFGFLCIDELYGQSYFQQQVDYDMQVELDTLDQILTVNGTMTYKNNSNEELEYLIMHLWMNAFQSKTSAFAEQQFLFGNRDFHFSKKFEMGGYENFLLSLNDQNLVYENYSINGNTYSDIVKVSLPEKLSPGTNLIISFSYRLKIPFAFDRAGFKEELYRLTQWYPKPAVYDSEGWHPMPYLSLGEFYSEFGNYRVSTKVPLSHSVAATGLRSEYESNLSISTRQRTEVFYAENVHDFAWFSSEYYIPYREALEIEDNNIIVNVFVKEDNEEWDKLIKYAKRSLGFFSEEIGLYPYPQMTIVEGSSDEDGGMEYPMITILSVNDTDQRTDHLISHEIGHQWFYSILASNERSYPWIDEGLTSYFDHAYDKAFYTDMTYDDIFNNLFLRHERDFDLLHGGVNHLHRTGYSTSILASADAPDVLNYISLNYEQMAIAFNYLAQYLGEDTFKDCVQTLFNYWKHKHLSPTDLQDVFERKSGRDLDWFFQDLLSKPIEYDFKINKVKFNGETSSVEIEKEGNQSLPFSLSIQSGSKNLFSIWDTNSVSKTFIQLPTSNFDQLIINKYADIADQNWQNNHYFKKKKFPIKPRLLGFESSTSQSNLNWSPGLLFNRYDGIMLGLNLYSDIFPALNHRYLFSPHYGFGSNEIAGFLAYEQDLIDFPNDSSLRKLRFFITGQRFNETQELVDGQRGSYWKIRPGIALHFKQGILNYSKLDYQLHIINQRSPLGQGEELISNYLAHQINFEKYSRKRLWESHLNIQLQYENYTDPFENEENYLRSTVEWENAIYFNPDNQFFFRFFSAYFPINSNRESSSYASLLTRGTVALSAQGHNDQLYNEFYFTRNGTFEDVSSHIFIRDGGFKSASGPAYNFGMTNHFMLALNTKVDIPLGFTNDFKVRPYIDLALSSHKATLSENLSPSFYYNSGLAIEIGEVFGIYYPVTYSSDFDPVYAGTNIWQKLSFKFDMSLINPWKIADHPGLLID